MDHNGRWFPRPEGAMKTSPSPHAAKAKPFLGQTPAPNTCSTYRIQTRLPSAKPSGKEHGMAVTMTCRLRCWPWQRCSSYRHLQFSSHALFIVSPPLLNGVSRYCTAVVAHTVSLWLEVILTPLPDLGKGKTHQEHRLSALMPILHTTKAGAAPDQKSELPSVPKPGSGWGRAASAHLKPTE